MSGMISRGCENWGNLRMDSIQCNYHCMDRRLVSNGRKTFMVNQRDVVAASSTCPSTVTLVEFKELQKGKRVSDK